MIDSELMEKIINKTHDLIEEMQLELFECQLSRQGPMVMIRILVDKPWGGIAMDDCSRLNQRIQERLEMAAVLTLPYVLEVSSPGIDRPIKSRKDFRRVLKRFIRVQLKEPLGDRTELTGVVANVADEGVTLLIKQEPVMVPWRVINQAGQIL